MRVRRLMLLLAATIGSYTGVDAQIDCTPACAVVQLDHEGRSWLNGQLGGVDNDLVRRCGTDPYPSGYVVVVPDYSAPVGSLVFTIDTLRSYSLAVRMIMPSERRDYEGLFGVDLFQDCESDKVNVRSGPTLDPQEDHTIDVALSSGGSLRVPTSQLALAVDRREVTGLTICAAATVATLDAAISVLGASTSNPGLDISMAGPDGILSHLDPIENVVPPPPKIERGSDDSLPYCLYQRF